MCETHNRRRNCNCDSNSHGCDLSNDQFSVIMYEIIAVYLVSNASVCGMTLYHPASRIDLNFAKSQAMSRHEC